MKKFISLFLAVVLLLSLSVGAYAAAHFINDEANAGNTELVSAFEHDQDDVTDKLAVTQYLDRDKLPEADKKLLEDAYDSIEKCKDIRDLNPELKNIVIGSALVASDLVDLVALEEVSYPLMITLKNDNLDGFITLLHYTDADKDGEYKWDVVSVDREEDKLSFLVEDLSPFAVICTGSGEGGEGGGQGARFINSVADVGEPKLGSATQEDGKDVSKFFIVTAYDEIPTLPKDLEKLMRDAFNSIKNAKDLRDLNEELRSAAGDQAIAVSDLFDLRAVGDVEYSVTIEVDDDYLNNFLALLHYVDGKWYWVDAEVDGNKLSFSVDSTSPFAIIVTVDQANSARTGENMPIAFIAVAVLLAGASAWFFYKGRKIEG